jgi:hypothetical protein
MTWPTFRLPGEERIRRPIDLMIDDVLTDFRLQQVTYIAEALKRMSPLDIKPEDLVLESFPLDFETDIDMDRGYWDVTSPTFRVSMKFRLRLKTEEEKAQEAAQKALEADEDEVYKPAIL